MGIASFVSMNVRATANVMVKGRGFELGQAYLDAVAEFYETSGFTTTADQYMTMAARIKIFALEAKDIGLEPVEIDIEVLNTDDPVKREFMEDFAMAEAYLADVFVNYPVEDKVIESYYRSNPKKFRDDSLDGDGMMPLDDELKARLRQVILREVRSHIANETYLKLRDSYEVRFQN